MLQEPDFQPLRHSLQVQQEPLLATLEQLILLVALQPAQF